MIACKMRPITRVIRHPAFLRALLGLVPSGSSGTTMSGSKVELTRPKGEDWNDMFKGVSVKDVRAR